MGNSYKRKTDNPKMGWSDERRAKYSKQCKESHADGTWHKKSKKAVGEAISKGKLDAVKRRNRSEGQKRRHAKAVQNYPATTFSENLLDSASLPDENVVIKPKKAKPAFNLPMGKIIALFDLVEENFGVRPNLNEFVNSAVEEKLAKVVKALHKN
jgi:hypothetical protein